MCPYSSTSQRRRNDALGALLTDGQPRNRRAILLRQRRQIEGNGHARFIAKLFRQPRPQQHFAIRMAACLRPRSDGVGGFDELASELTFQDLDICTEERISLQIVLNPK